MPDNANVGYVDVTIANGQQTSDAADLSSGRSVVGVLMPAAFTGTALTFTTCATSGGTYVPVHEAGGDAYSVTVAAARYIPIPPADLSGVRYLKVVSGSAEGGARVVRLVVRHV